MFAIQIVVGILTLITGLVLLSKFSMIDGLLAAGFCIWSWLLVFGGITNPVGYLIAVACYYGLSSLVCFGTAAKKQDGTFTVAGLIFLALSVWALLVRF